MKSKFLFIALIFVVCCCSPKGDGSVSEVIVDGRTMYVFSLNTLKSDTATIPLSSIVDDFTLVQLETIDDAFFKPWYTTVTDNFIGVRQQDGQSYMLFNRSGKFQCTVGSKGQGPGEYSFPPYDDIIDEKNGLIYLAPFMDDKILVYDTSGKYLRNITLPQRVLKAKLFLTDNIMTVLHMPFPGSKTVAFQLNVNTGEVVKELAPPPVLIVQSADGEIFNTRNASGIFDFYHTGSDTLYHLEVSNNRIKPFFTMTFNSSEQPWKQYYQLNQDLILTNMFAKGLVATDVKNKTSKWIKVVNDYYGNMPAPTSIMQFRNGYWVLNIQPEQLIDDINNRLAQRSCTEKDKQALTTLLSKIKEDENNVVIFGKLKNEIKTKLW